MRLLTCQNKLDPPTKRWTRGFYSHPVLWQMSPLLAKEGKQGHKDVTKEILLSSGGQETSPLNSAHISAIHSELGRFWSLSIDWNSFPGNQILHRGKLRHAGIKSNKHWISVAQLLFGLSLSSGASLSCSLWLILQSRKGETWDLNLAFHI